MTSHGSACPLSPGGEFSEDQLHHLFSALSNDIRLTIVQVLAAREAQAEPYSISELAEVTGTSRFVTSHHLSILRRTGLVRQSIDGHIRRQSIDRSTLERVEDWLYPLLEY